MVYWGGSGGESSSALESWKVKGDLCSPHQRLHGPQFLVKSINSKYYSMFEGKICTSCENFPSRAPKLNSLQLHQSSLEQYKESQAEEARQLKEKRRVRCIQTMQVGKSCFLTWVSLLLRSSALSPNHSPPIVFIGGDQTRRGAGRGSDVYAYMHLNITALTWMVFVKFLLKAFLRILPHRGVMYRYDSGL